MFMNNIKMKLYLLSLFLCCMFIAFNNARAVNNATNLEKIGLTTVELLTELQDSIDNVYNESTTYSTGNNKIDWKFIGEFGKLYELGLLELKQLTPLQKNPKVGAALFLQIGAEYLVKNLNKQKRETNNSKFDQCIKLANYKLNQIKEICNNKLSTEEKAILNTLQAGTVFQSLKNNSTNSKLKRLFEITKSIPASLKNTINRGIELLK